MGRHQQAGRARRAHLSLGAASLAGVMCSATYALAAPVAAPAAVVSPVAAPAAPAHTAAAQAATARTTTTKAPERAHTSCDLSGPPVFGDPAHPDEITNRDCGYADSEGRQRSRDPWIDDQLRDAGR